MYHYPIAIEMPADAKQSYGVSFPDVPGCFSAGDTIDEVMSMAREALDGHLECLAADGEEPPKPSELSAHTGKPEFQGCAWAVVSIDPFPYMGKSQKVNVTMPAFLLKKIELFIRTHPDFKDRSRLLQRAAMRLIDEAEGSTVAETSDSFAVGLKRGTVRPENLRLKKRARGITNPLEHENQGRSK